MLIQCTVSAAPGFDNFYEYTPPLLPGGQMRMSVNNHGLCS